MLIFRSFLCLSNFLFIFLTIAESFFILFQALNLILLTSSELSELRDLLKKSLVNPAGKDLFVSLYASWCHSPMAIISLCLLAQVRYSCLFVVLLLFSSKQTTSTFHGHFMECFLSH